MDRGCEEGLAEERRGGLKEGKGGEGRGREEGRGGGGATRRGAREGVDLGGEEGPAKEQGGGREKEAMES